MTIRDLFRKHDIFLSENNEIQVESYTISVSFDRRNHAIIVKNDFDGLHAQCLRPSQAVFEILLAGNSIVTECFRQSCREIAEQCVEEGYPSHGSNYDLRVSQEMDYFEQNYDLFWNIIIEDEEV